MFNSALGRFTSPDPGNAGADPYNPQSWNGYGYVAGNPLVNTDPSGMSIISRTSGDPGDCYSAEFSSPCGDPSAGWGGGGYDGIDIGIGGGGRGTTYGGGGGTISNPVMPPAVVPTPVSSFPGVIGSGANGFLDPAGVGALAADACITNPICVATAGALGLGGYLVYKLSPLGPVTVPGGWQYTAPKVIFQSPISLMGRTSRQSGKAKADDTPDWASHYPKKGPGESCADFAARILMEQYGPGHPNTIRRGSGSEHSKIKKACERGGFEECYKYADASFSC